MKKIIFLIISFTFITNTIKGQELKTPKGIIYHKTSTEINEKVKQVLVHAINNSGKNLEYDKTFICGPNLWEHLIQNKVNHKISGININFNIPDKGGYKIMHGRAIQKIIDFYTIWNFIIKTPKNNNYIIRKPNKNELTYYWSVIPYEIEEPIYIIEVNKLKIIIDFNSDSKLLYIDIIH